MASPAYRRAVSELDPADVVVHALEIRHPALTDPVRVVADRLGRQIEGHDWIPLAFEARLIDDAEGRAPAAELRVDNVGRPLMRWVEAVQGGSGATVRVMGVRVPAGGAPVVEWEVTVDVHSIRADADSVIVRLGFDPLLSQPAVALRYDPRTAPAMFG